MLSLHTLLIKIPILIVPISVFFEIWQESPVVINEFFAANKETKI